MQTTQKNWLVKMSDAEFVLLIETKNIKKIKNSNFYSTMWLNPVPFHGQDPILQIGNIKYIIQETMLK